MEIYTKVKLERLNRLEYIEANYEEMLKTIQKTLENQYKRLIESQAEEIKYLKERL